MKAMARILLILALTTGCQTSPSAGSGDASSPDMSDTASLPDAPPDSGNEADTPDTVGTEPVDSLSLDTQDAAEADTATPPDPVSPVQANGIYTVKVSSDIVYAQGLRRSAWDAPSGEEMPLRLDLYEPEDCPETAKPALVVIHGGGFKGGSKTQGQLVEFCNHFASRGWVAISVDYRVAKDYGSLPADWLTLSLPGSREAKADQAHATYAAGRDVKAAVRWLRAHALEYGVHPDYVAATGGSAGAFLALMLGVSDDGDYKDELTTVDDPTLESTNLSQSSAVQVIIDHWGGVGMLEQLTLLDGISRWDATDAPVQIVHGTQDESVSFENAQAIKAHYEQTGVPYSYYPLDAGHGAWSAKIEGKTLWESAYDFAVIHLALEVQDEAM